MGRPPEGDGETPASSLWVPERRALTVGLVSTVTLVAAEALAVVTVMPQVARSIGGLRLYGWVFSAFLLGSMVGIVAAGREADRSGPARPYAAGLACFSAGLVVAGAGALRGLVRLGPATASPEAGHGLVEAVRTGSSRRCSASGDVVGGPR